MFLKCVSGSNAEILLKYIYVVVADFIITKSLLLDSRISNIPLLAGIVFVFF